MVTYFTDTDTDITPSKAEHYGYKLISMPYNVGLETVYPYVDFTEFKSKEFYDMLRRGTLPTTNALSKEKYIEYFEPEFKKGNDIFYVHFSKNMTATFDFMNKALDELKVKYPERKFYEVDCKAITIGAYAIVCEIGELILAGKTPQEILTWAEKEVDRYAMYFFAEDLKFFRRSGRVSGMKAMMGNFLGIRPIIYMNADGKMESIGSEMGREKTLNRLIAYMEELGDDIKGHRIILGHSDCVETAKMLEDKIKAKFGDNLNIEYVVVNPTAGSHCGPNGVGVCFHAKHR